MNHTAVNTATINKKHNNSEANEQQEKFGTNQ